MIKLYRFIFSPLKIQNFILWNELMIFDQMLKKHLKYYYNTDFVC